MEVANRLKDLVGGKGMNKLDVEVDIVGLGVVGVWMVVGLDRA